MRFYIRGVKMIIVMLVFMVQLITAQGVTTGDIRGMVTKSSDGTPLVGANVVANHIDTGVQYGSATGGDGRYYIPNIKVGGPYTVKVFYIGYEAKSTEGVYVKLNEKQKLDFTLKTSAIEGSEVVVSATLDDTFSSDRTGASTNVGEDEMESMPSVKRSTRDFTRFDPRSDGNFSFSGRNWLYNSISLDGSYFGNAFGLDDPAPGGQANAEPVPFDAVEQVQVSVMPFDVREGGFTGAGINTVTKSGTNTFKGSFYTYNRNETLIGNEVSGNEVIANPDLSFSQNGVTFSGPIIKNKLFFFVNAEMERREDPGTNFTAAEDGNDVKFGESRVDADVMDSIRERMMDVYNYDTGPYQGYLHKTENDKLLLKLDWNINDSHNLTFRYNMLDAVRDLPPHGFVLSFHNTGRGPNSSSLPFKNSGYAINNDLDSYALELNSLFKGKAANRFFFSYNKFRDFRVPFSEDFPTIEIGENGVTYTTLGHEPFSIHNILDQDVLQITDNFSYYLNDHAITAGFNYEKFEFFNSFNIFRHGVFFLEASWAEFLGGATFSSIDEFMAATSPDSASQYDFRSKINNGPFKGENIEVSQFSLYAQDEWAYAENINLIYGLRIDIPKYGTTPVDNPFSRGLTLLDENDNPETVDQSDLPGESAMYSPRVGVNWDVFGNNSLQLRGGTGLFTGRVPFVWIGNVISNPGQNPNLYPLLTSDPDAIPGSHVTDSGDGRTYDGQSTLQTSFDLNAMDPDFEWPQVWNTNLAVDALLPMDLIGTFEFTYGKDINAVYVRNADLDTPQHFLSDGRPYFGGFGDASELNYNPFSEGDGVYVIDNTDDGYNMTLTGQLKKSFSNGFDVMAAYTYIEAKNNLRSTEIASVLWQSQPVQGDPNKPKLSWSEFGNPHRFIATGSYTHSWNDMNSTSFGLFFEYAQGNRYTYNGGNRYSFIYSGDVNGDGQGGNDLIYIPEDANDILLADPTQWNALDAFIEQDDYLSENRGKIAERNGAINPWFSNIDLKVLHNYTVSAMGRDHRMQFSLDILNFANFINSDWGVRQSADPMALSPLSVTEWDNGEPVLEFNGVEKTYIDDPGPFSRWSMQIGIKYLF